MKDQRPLGLVVEGSATSSLVLRLPGLAEGLGPIKAGKLGVARRVSNFLRAGYAVSGYEELKAARLVLLRVPDIAIPRIVEELCSSELGLRDVSFVLCETCLSTSVLQPLQTRGAWTATLSAVQTPRKSWFILEGQLTAVRQVRRFLDRGDARVFELRPGTKPLYFAAQLLTTALPTLLFSAAQQALRTAGVTGNPLHELMEEMSMEMFRAFANGVRFSYPAGRVGCTSALASQYLDDIRAHHPQIARILDEHLAIAMRNGAQAKAPASP